ncbi:MAG: HlyD family efflux transporter periplasmic adaptor subunit [Synechococcales cyanobacterium RM1_1_8]|nr:HlyD family efflux transporter periplasmic adaptor subunit [Synechococcales cyanobacterium RM1_1_8]
MALTSRPFSFSGNFPGKSPGLIIAGLSVLSLGIVGFGLYLMLRTEPSTPAPEGSAAAVNQAGEISALGRIEPIGGVLNVASPSAMGTGRVMQIRVREGDRVTRGQPLAIMDSYEQLWAAAAQAEAQVKEAQSNLAQVKAGEKTSDIKAELANARAEEVNLKVQQVNVSQQEANVNEKLAAVDAKQAARNRILAELKQAERDVDQARILVGEGALAGDILTTRQFTLAAKVAELEEAKAEIAQAQQQLEQAKQQRQQALGEVARREQQLAQATEQFQSARQVRPEDVQRAEASVQTALANFAKAQAELEQAVVVAPADGQVLKIHATSGEAVGSEGILDLGRTDRMTVVAEVYETDIGKVQMGQLARVKTPALERTLEGRVVKIGLQIGKQDVLDADPAADTDARVVEVTILLEDSAAVASLTNLQVTVAIDPQAPRLNPSPSPAAPFGSAAPSTDPDPAPNPALMPKLAPAAPEAGAELETGSGNGSGAATRNGVPQ